MKPNKNVNTSSMLCREATSDQARPDLTAYKILEIGNRDIIGIAISFLSDTHFRNIYYLINQYPYQYLVFIVRFLQDSGYASGVIIISTSPSTSLKPDESRGYPSTFEFYRPRHLLLWLDSYTMQLNQYEKKKRWWTSSPRRWANDTSMTFFPEWMKDPSRTFRTR